MHMMVYKIYHAQVGPGGSLAWVAHPGEEIIDQATHQKLCCFEAFNDTSSVLDVIIGRNADGSLNLPNGILVGFLGGDGLVLTPLAPKVFKLLEPDFDLEEIELAEKLVANG